MESGSTLAQAEEGLRESVSEEDRGREGKGIRLNERHLCQFNSCLINIDIDYYIAAILHLHYY